ncbi:MAG: hypothetical protein Q7R98_01045 [Candidatus Jorgensenbacteria bacterium]|nr:hypothetical protein [Candidatus Jorgensenbacteria bacterium]
MKIPKEFLLDNWFKLTLLSLVILTIAGGFYWFGLRPSIIKSGCAWIEVHYDAVPAKPASPDWPECLKSKPTVPKTIEEINKLYGCYDATPAQPERNSKKQPSNAQYVNCLREHGL